MMYTKYLGMHLKKTMQYRSAVLFLTITQFFLTVAEIISMILLFNQFKTVDGWNFYHICIMYGVIMVSFPLVECFARGFDQFPVLVRSGDLDRMFVRPRSMFLQVLCSDFDMSKFGRVISGVIISIVALCNVPIEWTVMKAVVLLTMYASAFMITFGLFLINSGISIFTIGEMEFMNIFTNGGRELCQYPISIYGKWFARFFTFILPLSCFNYLPLLYLVNGTSFWLYGMAPIYGSLFFIPCYFFFRWALGHYKGSGT